MKRRFVPRLLLTFAFLALKPIKGFEDFVPTEMQNPIGEVEFEITSLDPNDPHKDHHLYNSKLRPGHEFEGPGCLRKVGRFHTDNECNRKRTFGEHHMQQNSRKRRDTSGGSFNTRQTDWFFDVDSGVPNPTSEYLERVNFGAGALKHMWDHMEKYGPAMHVGPISSSAKPKGNKHKTPFAGGNNRKQGSRYGQSHPGGSFGTGYNDEKLHHVDEVMAEGAGSDYNIVPISINKPEPVQMQYHKPDAHYFQQPPMTASQYFPLPPPVNSNIWTHGNRPSHMSSSGMEYAMHVEPSLGQSQVPIYF